MREVSEPDAGLSEATSATAVGRSAIEQIVAQQAAIAHIGQSALGSESMAELFDEACALASRVLETEMVSLLELMPEKSQLKVVAGVGWRPGTVGSLVVSAAANGSQSGFTLATGGPVIVTDFADETRFTVTPSLLEEGAKSGMSVRIGGQDTPYGVLTAFTGRRGRYTRDDANFLQAVANVLAAAIHRFRTEAELRASRDQLAAIVSTIDEGITVRQSENLIFANDAAARVLGYPTAAELLGSSDEVVARYELFDEEGKPLDIETLPSRRVQAGQDRAESIIGFRMHDSGEIRWSVVRATAVRDDAGQIVNVISTFREITDERWTRESRAFMAEAVAALSSTLDTVEAAQRLADITVPRLADYCTVHLVEPEGGIKNVALAHSDAKRLETARRLQQMRPVSADRTSVTANVISEGKPQLSEITPEIMERAAASFSSEELELIRTLDMRWYLAVPLMGRSGPIGALALVMAESGRILGQRELALAEELGVRAGIALENARLYQTADDRRAQLDAVLGALGEAVLVFDSTGIRQLANSAAVSMFDGALPATQGDLLEQLGAAEVTTDDEGPVELPFDGKSRWVEMGRYRAARISSTEAGGPTVVVLRDVTEARAARAARDAFLGVLSHELRTPITTIYGGSELLERDLDEERREEVIVDIRVEAERLARLVEDLLVMTRIERGTVEISDEPILIQRLLPSIVHAFNGQWPDVEVRLNLSERLSAVRGDPTYVEQVVRNLLTNAVRYGQGAKTGIELVAEERDDEVCVRVRDDGPGLGESDPEQLFELFYRSDAARAVPGGAGIGLFVCRNLVEAMGGRIWAIERPGGGAEFGFTLPVMESDF